MVETDRFESLRHFNDTRTRLVEAADALAKLAEKRRDTGLSLRAWALSRKLDNASFRVVLVGGQKRGKSTLINSLLGTRLLPAGVIPMTSVVTTIAYSEQPCARVLLAGGEVEEVSISRFPDYVADRDSAKGAISVEVMYPSTFLRYGVTLVDTPDTESGENGDAQTLGRVAEGADLLLLLLSADQPVSHAELDLLRATRRVAPVFVVQNKADYLPRDERRESLDFLRKVLIRELGDGATRVMQVSAKRALNARLGGDGDAVTGGVARLEKAVADFLAADKGAELLAEARLRLGRLAMEASQFVLVELRSSQLPDGDLYGLAGRFQEQIKEVFTTQRRAEFNIRRDTLAVASQVEAEIKELIFRHLSMVDRRTEETFARAIDLRGRVESMKALAEELDSAAQGLLAACVAIEYKHAGRSLEKIKEIFERHAAEVVEELERLTKTLFGIGVTLPIGDNILFLKEGEHLVSASSTPSAGVGLLPLILPTRFAKRIARLALRRAATDTIKVAVEIGQSFRRGVENESQSFIRDFQERVRLNMGKIEDALVRCEGMQHAGPVEREARVQLLAKDVAKLEAIQELAGS